MALKATETKTEQKEKMSFNISLMTHIYNMIKQIREATLHKTKKFKKESKKWVSLIK